MAKRKPKPYVRVTPEILEEAFEAIAEGMTLSDFCRQPGRPDRRNIVRAIDRGGPEVTERFMAARGIGFDALAEDALRIIDQPVGKDNKGRTDTGAVQLLRARVDTRLRLLSKWCTARYGERVQVAGDPDAPLRTMSDEDVMKEVLALLATAKGRQLRGEKPPAVKRNGTVPK